MKRIKDSPERCHSVTRDTWDYCTRPMGHKGECLSAGLWLRFICWFSARYFDIHDYKVHCGGDGTPTHCYTYTCWNCGNRFEI